MSHQTAPGNYNTLIAKTETAFQGTRKKIEDAVEGEAIRWLDEKQLERVQRTLHQSLSPKKISDTI